MKKIANLIFSSALLLVLVPSIGLSGDDIDDEAIGYKATEGKMKHRGIRHRIRALEAEDIILQERIEELEATGLTSEVVTVVSETVKTNLNFHAIGTLTTGNSITIDGDNDTITSTSGDIGFDNENLTTTGTVSASAFIGDGSQLTGIPAGPQGIPGEDFEPVSSVKVYDVAFFPQREGVFLSETSITTDGTSFEYHKSMYRKGEYPTYNAIDYQLKDIDGNLWLTHSENLDVNGEVIRKLDFKPYILMMPNLVQQGIPWGGAAEVEVKYCEIDGTPISDCEENNVVTETRFHVETRTMLGIEDIEVNDEPYEGCLKTREDRMSHVWGSDRSRIRFRCPGIGLVKEYRMEQRDNNLTEGRLYELNTINPVDNDGD